jgi:hypothetical protein
MAARVRANGLYAASRAEVEMVMLRIAQRLGFILCALSAGCGSATNTEDALDTVSTPRIQGPVSASTAAAFGGGGREPSGGPTMAPAPGANAPTGGMLPASPPAAAPPVAGSAAMPPAPANECGLNTRFMGDAFCIKPPPPEQGFQLHIGPSNYDNPEPQYVLEPGQEVTEPWSGVSPNEREIYFFYRQQRMRPGSHHLLINTGMELIVSSQNPVSDLPAGGKIAPEDQGVGIALPARAPLFGSIHYINATDKPILKEVWVNFWYKDPTTVTERAQSIFSRAPINIAPGSHVVVSADCPIMGSGRVLRLFGHKHANNVRWSTYRVRNGQRDLLFEDYDHWEEPLILEYSSITQNPKPDRATRSPGGWSGMVSVQQGDMLRFECEIINNTNRVFTGENEAIDDEMCIQNGTIVGASILRGTCLTATTPVN